MNFQQYTPGLTGISQTTYNSAPEMQRAQFNSQPYGMSAPQFGGISAPQFGGMSAPQFGGTSAPQFGGISAPQFGGISAPSTIGTYGSGLSPPASIYTSQSTPTSTQQYPRSFSLAPEDIQEIINPTPLPSQLPRIGILPQNDPGMNPDLIRRSPIHTPSPGSIVTSPRQGNRSKSFVLPPSVVVNRI